MKTNYTIKNFRVFDKKGVTVEISPLTFLVGCNSSGKSSIVKSLSLLKAFFMNEYSSSHPVIGSTFDFSVKPNDTLGSFNNVIHSSSREKSVSLSYEVHSTYINEDVAVTLTLGPGNLGNAVITEIHISKKDGSLLAAATSGSSDISGSLTILKEPFKQYLIATRFRSEIDALRRFDPFLDSQTSKDKVRQLVMDAHQYCDDNYLVEIVNNKSILPPNTDDCALNAIDKFITSGVMIYFSVLDEIGDYSSPEKVCTTLKSKVKDSAIKNALLMAINHICEDFEKRKSPSFISYYRSLEEECIMNAGYFPNILNGDSPLEWLVGTFSGNRGNIVHGIAMNDESNNHNRNEESINSIMPYVLVYDVFTCLSEEDSYSYIVKGDYDDETCSRRIYPLFSETFTNYVNRFFSEVVSKDITEGIDYISSSRIQVRRMYPMEDRNEFSDAVKRYFETKTRFMSLNPPIQINVSKEDGFGSRTLNSIAVSDFIPGSFMSKWLRYFNVGDHMSLEMDKNNLGLLLKVYRTKSDKKGILLADMGYGITQLFSILLQIEEMIMSSLYLEYKSKAASKGIILSDYKLAPFIPRTVAIEEPEIHLHPRYQSFLAEMILEAYKDFNIQFIIETHSEYLLRKVQTLIGAKKLSSEEVSMIYVEDDIEVKKGAPKVRRIPIKDDGRLAEPFGPGFYDEADNLSLELFTKMGK